MDERDIQIFRTLMETRNVTKTAQALYMTQSAITKRLHKLEEELGAPLFLRSVKGLIPSPSADAVRAEMEQVQASFQRMKTLTQFAQGRISGHLKFGVSVNYARYTLPPLLKQYMTDYPEVRIDVATGQSLDLFTKLQENRLSMAVLRGHFPWAGESLLLSREAVYAVTSRANQGLDLSSLPYIHRQSDKPFMSRIQRWKLEQHITESASSIQVNDISTCLAMITSGIGWSILPEICLKDREDLLLRPLTFQDGTPFTRSTFVFYREEYARLPQVKIFLDRLKGGAA
ncbi:LysR family transcriptional regulator [Acidaminococcus fermentans]|jgi:DNA-binding transcriptional LysR family regulator|uniref:LysR family transcriptional regulator n=1 Tax=Acidaminococcus fermentans TaxID=905 RepID=UPI002430FEEE|nr:LysR family transcriptional regulator [Acidaminococcus fermentans]